MLGGGHPLPLEPHVALRPVALVLAHPAAVDLHVAEGRVGARVVRRRARAPGGRPRAPAAPSPWAEAHSPRATQPSASPAGMRPARSSYSWRAERPSSMRTTLEAGTVIRPAPTSTSTVVAVRLTIAARQRGRRSSGRPRRRKRPAARRQRRDRGSVLSSPRPIRHEPPLAGWRQDTTPLWKRRQDRGLFPRWLGSAPRGLSGRRPRVRGQPRLELAREHRGHGLELERLPREASRREPRAFLGQEHDSRTAGTASIRPAAIPGRTEGAMPNQPTGEGRRLKESRDADFSRRRRRRDLGPPPPRRRRFRGARGAGGAGSHGRRPGRPSRRAAAARARTSTAASWTSRASGSSSSTRRRRARPRAGSRPCRPRERSRCLAAGTTSSTTLATTWGSRGTARRPGSPRPGAGSGSSCAWAPRTTPARCG